MNSDIVDLRSFYASLLGRLAERSITMALSSVWANLPRRAAGRARLRACPGSTASAPMPSASSPSCRPRRARCDWPAAGPSATALVFDEELPLVDSSIDRMLLVHSLEHAENPRETLKEIWRVLSPAGRVVIVVPNRRGVWARFEHTPFGTGRPFSRGQLNELLREANFTPVGLGRGAVLPAVEAALHDALPQHAGAHRPALLADLFRASSSSRRRSGSTRACRSPSAPRAASSCRCCRRRARRARGASTPRAAKRPRPGR